MGTITTSRDGTEIFYKDGQRPTGRVQPRLAADRRRVG